MGERATTDKKARRNQFLNSGGFFVVGVVCGAALVGALLGRRSPVQAVPASAATRPSAPAVAAPNAQTTVSSQVTMPPAQPNLPTRTGTAWEFDAPTNSHYDPRPGHQHWHSGPTPDAATRAQLESQPAPMPGAPTMMPVPAPPPQ